jgi:enamine deaminase RidA (YjgF/YER057c/UK114 family)
MTRRSIDVSSISHANPIPVASRVGPLLVSSIIAPKDPGAESIPTEPVEQIRNLFHHIGEMLNAADGDWSHVAKITFHVPDGGYREIINGPWLEQFPDAASRPARYTQVNPAGGSMVACDFLAYIS